jgi:hypothetical protein
MNFQIKLLLLFTLTGVLSLGAAQVSADLVVLDNGGSLRGEIKKDSAEGGSFTIDTPAGAKVTLSRFDVKRVDPTNEAEAAYRELARQSPDTLEAHWKLVEWCRENRLTDQYKKHLARIVELDPDNEEARLRLGYQLVNGQWMTRDAIMAQRGMVYHQGQFRTRQHIEILERTKENKKAEAQWSEQIRRWRRWLDERDTDRGKGAYQAILAIRDPDAAKPLADLLDRETNYDARLLLIETLAQIESQTALDVIIQLALNDPDDEIRHRCLEHLIQSKRPGITTPFVRALRSRDLEKVNRAATALELIGDSSAIGPLIDALVTTHKMVVGGSDPNQQAYTFTPESGGFSFGGAPPKEIKRVNQNPAVRSALVRLSGGIDFAYDQSQWRKWLATQKQQKNVDLRRDL